MSEEDTGFSDPLYVLLGALLSAVITGLGYLCKNQCRTQQCDCFSPCCRFHSDSRLRETIRKEIEEDKKRSLSGDREAEGELSEEIELTLPKEGLP